MELPLSQVNERELSFFNSYKEECPDFSAKGGFGKIVEGHSEKGLVSPFLFLLILPNIIFLSVCSDYLHHLCQSSLCFKGRLLNSVELTLFR